MKVKFKTSELEYYYVTPLDKIKGKFPLQKEIIRQFKKKIQILISADSLTELRRFHSLNLEALKGDRRGDYSIRLNKQYRLIFTTSVEQNGDVVINVALVSEISKHYER